MLLDTALGQSLVVLHHRLENISFNKVVEKGKNNPMSEIELILPRLTDPSFSCDSQEEFSNESNAPAAAFSIKSSHTT